MTGRNLPVVPKPGSAVSAKQAGEIERQVWEALPHIDDIDVLEAGRRNLAALVAYLRAPELQRPALSAQRGVEARIGQLLGPAKATQGQRTDLSVTTEKLENTPSKDARADFRVLAKALDGEVEVAPEEWQKSRRALTALVRLRAGEMPETDRKSTRLNS